MSASFFTNIKILLLSIASLFPFKNACAEVDAFHWHNLDHKGTQWGGRAKIVDVWGRKALILQAAIRNESPNTIIIPVTYKCMPFHAKGLDYSTMVVRDKSDPFTEKYDFQPIRYSIMQTDPFLSPVSLPFSFLQIEPKEMVLFSPVMTVVDEAANFTKFEVKFSLKIEAPQSDRQLIKVKQIPNKGFEEVHIEKIDLGTIPVGKWDFNLNLLASTKETANRTNTTQSAPKIKPELIEKPIPDPEVKPQ